MRARPVNGRMPWSHARPFYMLLFTSFLLAIAAVAAAGWVCMSPLSTMTGLRPYTASRAQQVRQIRERNRIFFVQPEWLSGGGNSADSGFDVEWRWMIAETRARCAVVFILWLTGVSVLIWRYRRRRAQAVPGDHSGETAKLEE